MTKHPVFSLVKILHKQLQVVRGISGIQPDPQWGNDSSQSIKIKEAIIDLQAWSMRDNLGISDILEQVEEDRSDNVMVNLLTFPFYLFSFLWLAVLFHSLTVLSCNFIVFHVTFLLNNCITK